MSHQQQNPPGRGRSPSAASNHHSSHQSPSHIRGSHSPSPAGAFNPSDGGSSSLGLGLGLGLDPSNPASSQQYTGPAQNDFSAFDPSSNAFMNTQQPAAYDQQGLTSSTDALGAGQEYSQQLQADNGSYGDQTQGEYSGNILAPNFSQGDFSLFPPTSAEQQFTDTPLFATDNSTVSPEIGTMASSQTPHSPTPPHLLQPEPHQPPSADHSPSFNQFEFPQGTGRHSRNVSLGPADALLPGQVSWSQNPQFQQHRRSPSEYSDASSAAPSPNLGNVDTFDMDQRHSPMQQPQDAAVYHELHGIGSFSISDQGTHSPSHQHGRSPSHSPAISPRILPQSLPELQQQQASFLLGTQTNGYPGPAYGLQGPDVSQGAQAEMVAGQVPQLVAPTINIDFVPTATRSGFEQAKAPLDSDSLTPPDRGRPRSRPRASTDPFNTGGAMARSSSNSLSPNAVSDARSDASRSPSPLDRSGSGAGSISPNRRRQSTSAVPSNIVALRLADPEYSLQGAQGGDSGVSGSGGAGAGGPKRVQKHPATFQCSLCPKRFTRAYNLRSHLRTHTDERPFVCTVCGKAFARQHDRKRHESLHSGEKKFVCKGELKTGGQWGCGRRFARADALGRHFRSEAGRMCIKPLLDEEMMDRQRAWSEQRLAAAQQQHAQQQQQQQQQQQSLGMGMMQPPSAPMMGMDPNMGPGGGYPVDSSGQFAFPAALLAQYPALAQISWTSGDMSGGSGMEDEMGGGRSSFDASDYDDPDDGGYVSGPGTGFGQGGLGEGFGEMGYASDYGGR